MKLTVREVGDAIVIGGSVVKEKWKKKRIVLPHVSPTTFIRQAHIFVGGISSPKESPRKLTGSSEPEGVMPEYIAAEILKFEKNYLAERPSDGGSGDAFRQKRTVFVGPMAWLAQESGIDERRLFGYKKMEFKFVKFTHAQKILMALDHEYKLTTGEIPVVKNPSWSWRQYGLYMRSRGVL